DSEMMLSRLSLGTKREQDLVARELNCRAAHSLDPFESHSCCVYRFACQLNRIAVHGERPVECDGDRCIQIDLFRDRLEDTVVAPCYAMQVACRELASTPVDADLGFGSRLHGLFEGPTQLGSDGQRFIHLAVWIEVRVTGGCFNNSGVHDASFVGYVAVAQVIRFIASRNEVQRSPDNISTFTNTGVSIFRVQYGLESLTDRIGTRVSLACLIL